MKITLAEWYANYKGGINNLAVVHALNEKGEIVKSFTSSKNMASARKRGKSFQRKQSIV